MSEHDETLRKALEENARLRSEREESVRDIASSEYSGRLRFAERVYWAYAIVCVAIGVPAIHFFTRSYDTKSLITCAVIILVIYETTVLMKLWFHTARVKMSVLKDMKLLRLEVARLAAAVGVESPSEPPVKYEPMRGASKFERKLWIVACLVVAITVSSWMTHQWQMDSGQVVDNTMVILTANGGATSVTEMVQQPPYGRLGMSNEFPYFAPKDHQVRFIDPEGQKMPLEVTREGTHNRHKVMLSDAVFSDGRICYTRISEVPNAAKRKGNIWTYESDIVYSGGENKFSITVSLPVGAKVLSTEPAPTVEFDQDGRMALRFQATRGKNKKFAYSIRYELPTAAEQQE